MKLEYKKKVVRKRKNEGRKNEDTKKYTIDCMKVPKKFHKKCPKPYPPHQKGMVIEEAMHDFIKKNKVRKKSEFIYIPLYWTNIYAIRNCYLKPQDDIQEFLDGLEHSHKYFTVVQNDDGIHESVPDNVLIFSAGGNGHIPVPLTCDRHKIKNNKKRDIKVSFVGAIHYSDSYESNLTRFYMQKELSKYNDFVIMEHRLRNFDIALFEDLTSRSVFTLCPRGYGRTSFRLYEAMNMGSIPIYIYDELFLPYLDELNWEDFSILCHVDDIKDLPDIINNHTEDEIRKKQEIIKNIYDEYFSMEGATKKIIETIISKDPYKNAMHIPDELIKEKNVELNKNKKISFVITAYNEFSDIHPGKHIAKCIQVPLKDNRVEEIVVVDDHSEEKDYSKLKDFLSKFDKIKLHRHEENFGVFGTKLSAIMHANCDWVMSIDSDNYINRLYIDRIYQQNWKPTCIYYASFAEPNFDFRQWAGKELNTSDIVDILITNDKLVSPFLNDGNGFLNKNEYIRIFSKFGTRRFDLKQTNYLNRNENIRNSIYMRNVYDALDSNFINKTWLLNGNTIKHIEGARYYHSIDSDSSYSKAPDEKILLDSIYKNELVLGKLIDKIDVPKYIKNSEMVLKHMGKMGIKNILKSDYGYIPQRYWNVLYSILISCNFKRVLHIGCDFVHATFAFIEAIQIGKKIELHLCDNINRTVLELTDNYFPKVYKERSLNILMRQEPFDFVLITGNHEINYAKKELELILDGNINSIMVYGTRGKQINRGEKKRNTAGLDRLTTMLQYETNWLCLENHLQQNDVGIRGDLFFATRDKGIFQTAKKCFRIEMQRNLL